MKPEFEEVKARLRKQAPPAFAEPATKLNARRNLILEGETFRWEVK